MAKGHKHWNDIETIKLQRLFMAKKPMKEIYKQFPEYSQKRIYSKLTRLFPESFDIHTTRTERNYEKLKPIDYGTCNIDVIEKAKNLLNDRLYISHGIYFLDGKKVSLIQVLEEAKKKG